MDGVLVCNKPAGCSSNDLLNRLRGWTGQRKMGHAGTLDPDATGVLPVCVGRATRIIPFLMGLPKTYRAVARLGAATDTQDASGRVIAESPLRPSLTEEQVRTLLTRFQGTIEQVPPMYSALKRGGRRLYELARRGEEVDRTPRRVTVHSIRLLELAGDRLHLEVECGSGTYIRTLCHDIGQTLQCGAYMESLVRTRVGPMSLNDSVSPEEIEVEAVSGRWRTRLHPIDDALHFLPSVTVGAEVERRVVHGAAFSGRLGPLHKRWDRPTLCRVNGESGELLAVASFEPAGEGDVEHGVFHVKRVLVSSVPAQERKIR